MKRLNRARNFRGTMRNISPLLGMIALVTLVATASAFTARGASPDTNASRFAMPAASQQVAVLKREEDLALGRAERAVREMQTLARTVPEKELANNDARIVAEIRRLVVQRQAVRSLGAHGIARSNDSGAMMDATEQMQEMQMSFNLQYLSLQNQMQNENRQFTMVSNIMKTKHDTVKNSISNIR